MNTGLISTKPDLVIVATVERTTKMVLGSFILFMLGCFPLVCVVKLLFFSIESGGVDESNIRAVYDKGGGLAQLFSSKMLVLKCDN